MSKSRLDRKVTKLFTTGTLVLLVVLALLGTTWRDTYGQTGPKMPITTVATTAVVPVDTPPPTDPPVSTTVAAPTNMPVPVVIPVSRPTSTPVPIPTATPEPTSTPVPTATPEPVATETPVPTATVIPTATPLPTKPVETMGAVADGLAAKLPDVQSIPGAAQAVPSSSGLVVTQQNSTLSNTGAPAVNVQPGTVVVFSYNIANILGQNSNSSSSGQSMSITGGAATNVKVTIMVSAKFKIQDAKISKGTVTISGQLLTIEIPEIAPNETLKLEIDAVAIDQVPDANKAINAIAEGSVNGNKVVVAENSYTASPTPKLPESKESGLPIWVILIITVILLVIVVMAIILTRKRKARRNA